MSDPNTLPPAAIDAEQCVIGSLWCLGNFPGEQLELINLLAPAAFFLPQHQEIWTASGEVLRSGSPIEDVVFVREQLTRRGTLEEIGGVAYLAEIINAVPSAARWRHYAQIVREKAALRTIFSFSDGAAKAAFDQADEPAAIARKLRDQMDRVLSRIASTIDRSGAAGEVQRELRDEIEGRRRNEPWPWLLLTELMRSNLPGSIVLLCGGPGAGKTWLELQAMTFWLDHGISFSARMLEKPRRWHVRRVLALLCQDLRVLGDTYVRQHPEWFTNIAGEFEQTLDAIGERIHTNEFANGQHIVDVGDWIEERANAGDRLIIVDPITLAETSDRGYIDQAEFMRRVGDTVARTGATLIMATHPRQSDGRRPPTLDDFAGGRVFSRACDAAMHLHKLEGFKRANVLTDTRTRAMRMASVDRYLRIHKARDATGEGVAIAMHFDRNKGGLSELGVVTEWADDDATATAEMERLL